MFAARRFFPIYQYITLSSRAKRGISWNKVVALKEHNENMEMYQDALGVTHPKKADVRAISGLPVPYLKNQIYLVAPASGLKDQRVVKPPAGAGGKSSSSPGCSEGAQPEEDRRAKIVSSLRKETNKFIIFMYN
jgi:hypothetical protein